MDVIFFIIVDVDFLIVNCMVPLNLLFGLFYLFFIRSKIVNPIIGSRLLLFYLFFIRLKIVNPIIRCRLLL